MAFAAAMCTLVYFKMHMNKCDHDVQSVHMCAVGDVHVHVELVFFWNKVFNLLWLNAQLLKVELKQSILFFKNLISFLSMVAWKAWWECVSTILFPLETFSFSFETIFLFKELFSSKAISFSFSTTIILFFKEIFPSQRSFSLEDKEISVSYTHLTLPTIYSV